ncbi:MAG: GAF domain-containing SpoIIE family protein phosphatase [Actinomycetota bacterium]
MTVAHGGQPAPERRIEELERTLASLREDSEVAYVLLGLSGALAEVRSIEETLELAARTVPHLFGADHCLVARVTGGALEVVARSAPNAQRTEVAPGALRKVIEQRDVAFASDGLVAGDRAAIAIPLIRWDEVYGALYLGFSQPKEFGTRDTALARGVARQVGAALNNSRRFKLLQDLSSFGADIGSQLRTPAVMRSALGTALEMFDSEGAWFYLFDQSEKALVTTSGAGALALPERLARLSVAAEPWDSLLRGTPIVVDGIGRHFARSDLVGVATLLKRQPGSILGMLLTVLPGSRRPSTDELEAFNVLAGQVAQALETARRFERERSVARKLQSALLQTETVAVDGCDIGAIYEAADSEADVGGDFYDVIELPEGRFGIVVGDVSGKGAEAAAQTAMVKYMLRAFATRNPSPSSVLFHLNNALVKDMQEDRFTTVLYAVLSPNAQEVSLASAGHPTPLIYRAAREAVETADIPGMVAGCFEDQNFEAVTLKLAPGDIFVVFTDGLIEAKAGDELYGEERVIRSLIRNAHFESADDVARALYTEARNFGRVTDDTVVLTLKRKGA